MTRIFEPHIVCCVSVRALELLMHVLWLLKFLQKESWQSMLFACEIRHRSIFSKSDSFSCEFHGTIFDI